MSPNVLLIFTCLVLGILLRLSGKFSKNAPQVLNTFVIWVSLPALVLIQIPALLRSTVIDAQMLVPVSMAWVLFALSFLFFRRVGKALGWNQSEIGALVLTAGLGNTSFVGLPILESLFGAEGLRIGVLVDQPGTFLVLSTLGLVVASLFSTQGGRRVNAQSVAKNVMTFPPFVALIVALTWHFVGWDEGTSIHAVLEKLSATLIPLALVAVGFQLRVSMAVLRRQFKPLLIGLSFKLVLAPIFFIFLYMVLLGQHSTVAKITVLESAMAPMITASVVAEEFGLNGEIASLMVGIGIPLSLFTVYAWNLVLG